MRFNPFTEFLGDPLVTVPRTTQYIDKIYNAPKMTCSQFIGAESIHEENLENSIYFQLLQREGSVGIPKMSERTARSGQKIPDKHVTSRMFECPHYDMQDELKADDFLDKKLFGVDQEVSRNCISEKLAEKVQSAYDTFALVGEYNLWNAICGYVKNGMVENKIDIYSECGLTRKNFNIDFGKDNDANLYKQLLKVTLYKNTALSGALSTGTVAFCSPDFYEKLMTNKNIIEFNKHQNSEFLRNLNIDGFLYNNIYWVLYTEYTVEGSTAYPWLANGTAKVVPMGVSGLFNKVCAPADTVQGLLEDTKPQYATYRLNENETGFKIDTQTNQVVYCTRPEAIVTLTDVGYTADDDFTDAMFVPPVRSKARR